MNKSFAAQQQAADPTISAWVMASAGTGKTKVLIDRILNLLLAGYAPERIVCLTFTKAAAAEMANRLTQRLSRWAILSSEMLFTEMSSFLRKPPSQEELQRARALFALVLDTPGGMKIQTIHAFCQSVLGRFPLEAEVPAQFQVMDDLQAEALMHEAQQKALRPHHQDHGLVNALSILTPFMTDGTFSKIMGALQSEMYRLKKLLLFHESIDRYGLFLQQRLNLNLEFSFLDPNLIQSLKSQLSEDYDTEKNRYLTLKGDIRKKGLSDEDKERAQLFFDMEKKLAANHTAQKTLALLTIAEKVMDHYQSLKEARCFMDYDDLITRTHHLLSQPSVASWVLYKLDGGIDHLLIDEAQDTNSPQWAIIQSLTTEFFNPDKPYRTLFVVGDAKQSIYSFQGANPHDFMKLRRLFREQACGVGQAWHDVSLDLSFRSTPSVLKIVDSVFAQSRQGSAFQGVVFHEEEVVHQAFRTHHPGLVELWPLTSPQTKEKLSDASEEVAIDWQMARSYETTVSAPAQLAQHIADAIESWIDSRVILPSTQKPVEARDILILVRRRTELIDHLIRSCKKKNIPISGADRFVLTDHIAIEDLLALGRFLLLPSDDLSLACVLKSPLIGLTEEELYRLAYERSGSLWERLLSQAQETGLGYAADWLRESLRHVDYLPPYELYARVLGPMKGRQRFVERLGPEAEDVLDEFLVQALAFEQQNPISLQLFIGHLEANALEIKRDTASTQDNQVRIMTVHGSKGLQAPIVILPDTTSTPSLIGDPFLWTPDHLLLLSRPTKEMDFPLSLELKDLKASAEQEEYNRLLYVALTRAQDRLYIGGIGLETKISPHCWYKAIQNALMEIEGSETIEGCAYSASHNGSIFRFPALRDDQTAPPSPAAPADIPPPAWVSTPLLSVLADSPREENSKTFSSAAMDRGTSIHLLLEKLPDVSPSRRVQAAERWAPNLPFADRERVLSLLEDPTYAHFFGPQSIPEVPISGFVNGEWIQGRIDRLLIESDRLIIIDYKTGAVPAIAPLEYREQLARYATILTGMYPDTPIEQVILWVDGVSGCEIMPLGTVSK